MPAFPDDRPIIIFDGDCVMCSRFARFLMRNDRREHFRLLPAQSALGEALYAHYGKRSTDYESHILIENGRAYFKSEAGIRMLEGLGAPWSLASAARLLPSPVRDRIYDWIARNRIRWFGARQHCYLPGASERRRFLELAEERTPTPVLYRRLLGAGFDKLPRAVRIMHDGVRECRGEAHVERGGLAGNLVADLVGFPKAGELLPVSVRFDVTEGDEIWTRNFAGKSFSSRHRQGSEQGVLQERFGPLEFAIALIVEETRMRLELRGWRIFGLPLPLWLAPRVESYEADEDGEFVFYDDIRHPLLGRIVKYHGRLKPTSA